MTFGIYPGGAAGTVGPAGRLVPEDAAKRRREPPAAPRLARGRSSCTCTTTSPGRPTPRRSRPGSPSRSPPYTADGFQVELVLRYRPAAPGGDVAGFADFVRAAGRASSARTRT